MCSAAIAIGAIGVATKSRLIEVLSLLVGAATLLLAVLKK